MLKALQVNDYQSKSYEQLNDNLLYLDYIDLNYEFKEILIEPVIAYRHQGDFIGLLRDIGVTTDLFMFTMYINNINNPVEYDGKRNLLKIPIKPPIPAR